MFFNGLTPKKEDCCGCSACVKVCPRQALTFKIDNEGFNYPILNDALCVECGLCEKVCPMQHDEKTVSVVPGKPYAAVNCDRAELMASSSGGIFSVIADYVLSQGGCVYGAAFDGNMQLHHTGIFSASEMTLLRGSKYLQSDNGDVYPEIRQHLCAGRLVYYTGTGCQVAGLKLFLRKKYENLITSDILCHGTPPQAVFDETVKRLEQKYKGRVVAYKFRDKTYFGWSCSSSSSIERNGKVKYVGYDSIMNSFFNAFIGGVMNRESCYSCPYAQRRRPGDITLADYWGVEKYLDVPNSRNGVSAIIVNTPTGQKILNYIRSRVNLLETKIDDIAVINETLNGPTQRPTDRDGFFKRFNEDPSGTLASYDRLNRRLRIIYFLKRNPITRTAINLLKKIRTR